MVRKQKANFMFNTIICLIAQIAIVIYSIISLVLKEEYDAAFRASCQDNGWRVKESGVTMILTNVLICAPIWQFIECFYSIPLYYGYFMPEATDHYETPEEEGAKEEGGKEEEPNDGYG